MNALPVTPLRTRSLTSLLLGSALLATGLSGCGGGSTAASPSHQPVIATVAGNGTYGTAGNNGIATSAQLNEPWCAVTDTAGNLYIADSVNNIMRKVTASTGIISVYAGTGTPGYAGDNALATSASMYSPTGCALDTSGNLYVADDANNVIRKIAASTGFITTVAGNGYMHGTSGGGFSGDTGLAINAELNHPFGVLVDTAGDIFISDTGNQRVREVSATTGIITTIAGNGAYGITASGVAAAGSVLGNPEQLAFDPAGNLYIAEQGASLIAKINLSTHIITTVAGNGTSGTGVTVQGDGGPATSAQLNAPGGVAVNAAGDIYIADSGSNRIRVVTASTGIITTIAGGSTSGYSGDGGTPANALLHSPEGLFFDSTGNLYVADMYNYVIRKIAF